MNNQGSDVVYVVEDDAAVRQSLEFRLKTSGLTSRSFASGREFLEALEELEPGPILLDLRMPDVDGMEVLAQLRARKVEWPAVVITAHGEVAAAVRAIKLGALDFVEKPFEDALLQTCLANALRSLKTKAA